MPIGSANTSPISQAVIVSTNVLGKRGNNQIYYRETYTCLNNQVTGQNTLQPGKVLNRKRVIKMIVLSEFLHSFGVIGHCTRGFCILICSSGSPGIEFIMTNIIIEIAEEDWNKFKKPL